MVPNDKKLARNRFITVCSMWFHKFFQPNFHNFRFRWLLALHFQNLSNFCSQFHRGFFNLIFGGIFAIRPNCTTPRAFEPFSGSQLGFCRPLDLCYLTSFTAIRCCDGVIFHINFAVRLTALHSLVLPAFLGPSLFDEIYCSRCWLQSKLFDSPPCVLTTFLR